MTDSRPAPPTGPAAPRRRVLVSAYACGPGDEPEANAGWAFAVAAAVRHDVWVVTRERFRPAVEARRAADAELAAHLHVEYLELSERVRRLKRRAWDVYWYYVLWQRALTVRARELHRRHRFDVVHHVTFANDWLPCGAARLDGPAFVWGPVGGASQLPVRRLSPWLGPRGTAIEVVREVGTSIPRRLWGDRAARRAAVVVAQNPDVAIRFRTARTVVVEPNAAFVDPPTPSAPVRPSVAAVPPPADGVRRPGEPQHVAVLAARLLAWKGGRLAVATIAHPLLADWRLDVYGTGYEASALRSLAARLGVADRVRFLGHRPRETVLAAFASADAMLFPSMHDQAGWVAAEASALGTPVVCLPLGGPPLLAGANARVASLEGDIVRNLAVEVDRTLRDRGTPHTRWTADRLPALVDDWYAAALRP